MSRTLSLWVGNQQEEAGNHPRNTPLFMPGRRRSQLLSFTPIPAQRKEALGPVLYLGTIPTYSVSS